MSRERMMIGYEGIKHRQKPKLEPDYRPRCRSTRTPVTTLKFRFTRVVHNQYNGCINFGVLIKIPFHPLLFINENSSRRPFISVVYPVNILITKKATVPRIVFNIFLHFMLNTNCSSSHSTQNVTQYFNFNNFYERIILTKK